MMELLVAFTIGIIVGMFIANGVSYSRGWAAGKRSTLENIYKHGRRDNYPSEFRPATRTDVHDV